MSKIACPKCKYSFEPTDAMSDDIRKDLEVKFEAKRAELEDEFVTKARQNDEKIRLRAVADARSENDAVMKDMQARLDEERKRVLDAQGKELELRKRQRDLENDKKEFEISMSRKLDEERISLKEELISQMGAEYDMKRATWDTQRQGMERLIEDLKKKATQGSTQTQGEAFELILEKALKDAFPDDAITEVAKGVVGGDIIQEVKTSSKSKCGTIVYELKRTKSFSESWLTKLRDNMREAKADLAVLVTHVMPEGIAHIGQLAGVWVCDPKSAIELATVLRASLQEIAQARKAQVGKQGKAAEVWDYLGGIEFRGRVQGLVEALVSMKEGIDAERRALEKLWSRREKEVTRAMTSTAGFYGDLMGLGSSLQEIPQLALEAKD